MCNAEWCVQFKEIFGRRSECSVLRVRNVEGRMIPTLAIEMNCACMDIRMFWVERLVERCRARLTAQ